MRTTPVVLLLLALGASPAAGQHHFPPDSFTNLKVLPKNIDQRTLIHTMRGFALALGVRCAYCHEGRDDEPLDSIDFASDKKRPKRVARVMLKMVHRINAENLVHVPDRPKPVVEVKCATCHRGVARPRLLDDDLSLMLADSGLEAAARRYRFLRQRYYGSGAYDFRELTLTVLAEDEARAGRTDNALGLLNLNGEFFPASGTIELQLGEVYLERRDTAAAIAHYRAALAKDTTLEFARQRIAALAPSGPP